MNKEYIIEQLETIEKAINEPIIFEYLDVVVNKLIDYIVTELNKIYIEARIYKSIRNSLQAIKNLTVLTIIMDTRKDIKIYLNDIKESLKRI